MIKEIKYKRKFSTLNNILNNCFMYEIKSGSYHHLKNGGSLLMFNIGLQIYEYNRFTMLGMSEDVSKEELIEFINERFGK